MSYSLPDETITKFPKLIVLDLDNTLWTPELYQLRQLQFPVAGQDVQLLPGSLELIAELQRGNYFPPTTQFAVASRTKSVEWAHDLLDQFNIRPWLDRVEIFPGDKTRHFENLRRDSGVAFRDMLFFDDARDGRYGNCRPVSALGVLSVHCPTGLETRRVWELALRRFQEWDGSPDTIVEWDGSVTHGSKKVAPMVHLGTVKTTNPDKRYGFISPSGKKGTVFFHFTDLPPGVNAVQPGDSLQFTIEKDPRNGDKFRAANIQLINSHRNDSLGHPTATPPTKATISMPAFSMNLPFAALLANGYKTLESRNGTMFQQCPEGTQMLLHVGRRTYPDGDRHLEILSDAGLTQDQIQQLKSLPPKFDRGMVVAIVTLGRTYETTTAQRSTPEMQRRICAHGPDSGRRLTEIQRVAYLKRPIPMAAQGGIFSVEIDPQVLPDDWELATPVWNGLPADKGNSGKHQSSTGTADVKGNKTERGKAKKSPVYSISG